MYEGFYDHQVNLIPFGSLLYYQEIRKSKRVAELITDYRVKYKSVAVVLLSLISSTAPEPLDLAGLEQHSSEPTYIGYCSGHEALINQSFLVHTGIELTADFTELIPGWYRVQLTGKNRGLSKSAWSLQPQELRQQFANIACEYYQKLGCRGLDTFDGWGFDPEVDWQIIQISAERFSLKLRLLMQGLDSNNADNVPRFSKIANGTGEYWVDGSIGAETAALTLPYSSGKQVKPYMSEQDVANAVDFAFSLNLTPCLHTIGDAALDIVLNFMSSTYLGNRKIRLFHLCVVREEQFPWLKKYNRNLELVINPGFYMFASMYKSKLNGSMHKYIMPYIKMLGTISEVHYGSDAPVTMPNPTDAIDLLGSNQSTEQASNVDFSRIFEE